MAEDREDKAREDLTEEASPHRLEEYRKKGIVSQSKELTGLAILMASALTITLVSPQFGFQMTELMREIFGSSFQRETDLEFASQSAYLVKKSLLTLAVLGVPVGLVGFFVGIMINFAQTGPIFSFDPITPDFDKINPISGLKKLISLRQVKEAARLVFKMVVVISVAYSLVRFEVLSSPNYFGGDTFQFIAEGNRAYKSIFSTLIVVLLAFAAVDFVLQKSEYSKNLRMTKQEAKQENKEREGDPQIRARIRAAQREMARKRMMQAVKKADVVITNPTHIAVALVYDRIKMTAPKVVAKGADLIAQNIKKVAEQAGVPLVENVPLARTLFKSVKIGQSIPRALYQAVAEVLAFVYRLKKGLS